jgi:hypothetical protein
MGSRRTTPSSREIIFAGPGLEDANLGRLVVATIDTRAYPDLMPGDWSPIPVTTGALGLVIGEHYEESTMRTFLRVIFPRGVGWINASLVRGFERSRGSL